MATDREESVPLKPGEKVRVNYVGTVKDSYREVTTVVGEDGLVYAPRTEWCEAVPIEHVCCPSCDPEYLRRELKRDDICCCLKLKEEFE